MTLEEEVRDHMLMLVNANNEPVIGKTIFMHQMFLIFKQVSPELKVSFFPYQFGGYSNTVSRECNWLLENGFIESAKKGRAWTFSITDKGKLALKQTRLRKSAMRSVKESQITRIKSATHDLGLQKTIERLKHDYPQYFIYARV